VKKLWITAVFIGWCIGTVFALPTGQQPTIDALPAIDAGDPLTITVMVPDGNAGETLPVTVFNGVQQITTTLTLGSGGVAIWYIPEDTLIQAGESLIHITYDHQVFSHPLEVLPTSPDAVDLFTTANTLSAYGDGSATIMMLPRDQWGNATDAALDYDLSIRYPDGTAQESTFTYQHGLGWLTLHSVGDPGRVRLSLESSSLTASLELMQTASVPYTIELRLSPDCVLNDGRDRVTLVAVLRDREGSPVSDGTLVTIDWGEAGSGYGRSINGRVELSLPAPTHTGIIRYQARSGNAVSNVVFLRVTEEGCTDDR